MYLGLYLANKKNYLTKVKLIASNLPINAFKVSIIPMVVEEIDRLFIP